MTIHVQVSVWTYLFLSLGLYIIPRSRILGHMATLCFNISRCCQTIFHRGSTILCSHQQCMRILISSYPCQHLLLSVLLTLAIKWV